MATLKFTRPFSELSRDSLITIYLDGKKKVILRTNETKEVEVKPGKHVLRLWNDFISSRKYEIQIEENETLQLTATINPDFSLFKGISLLLLLKAGGQPIGTSTLSRRSFWLQSLVILAVHAYFNIFLLGNIFGVTSDITGWVLAGLVLAFTTWITAISLRKLHGRAF